MTKVAFIVNGGPGSAMDDRAREFARRLSSNYDIRVANRSDGKVRSIFNFFLFLKNFRPDVTYVFDVAYSGVLGAALFKFLFRNALIVDTGDAIYELARSTGNRSRLGLWLTKLLERFALRFADHVVVRGTFHQKLLAEQGIAADVIQDGVDVAQFAPNGRGSAFAVDGNLTIGIVGTSIWSEKLRMCYGWELVETLRLLKDKPVKGIMIGDGSGIEHLRELARSYGIEERIEFAGRVPLDQLPTKLASIDVCLSTQTNNVVGQVRTTGKLPLYMAAGRYILASDVGEASLVLKKEMLVPYVGVRDESYPEKLASRINDLLSQRENLKSQTADLTLASRAFDYSNLAERLRNVIDSTATKTR